MLICVDKYPIYSHQHVHLETLSLPTFINHSMLRAVMLLCTTGYLTSCDHVTEAIILLPTASYMLLIRSWIYQSCVVQSIHSIVRRQYMHHALVFDNTDSIS